MKTRRPSRKQTTRRWLKAPARLAIEIGRWWYALQRLDVDPTVAKLAWRVTGRTSSYDVHVRPSGEVVCECPDFSVRRQNLDPQLCKHARALREAGLLPRVKRRG